MEDSRKLVIKRKLKRSGFGDGWREPWRQNFGNRWQQCKQNDGFEWGQQKQRECWSMEWLLQGNYIAFASLTMKTAMAWAMNLGGILCSWRVDGCPLPIIIGHQSSIVGCMPGESRSHVWRQSSIFNALTKIASWMINLRKAWVYKTRMATPKKPLV